MTKPVYSKSEIDIETTFSLIIYGLKISKDRGRNIISYAETLIRDYENKPADALKEIPFNLKSNGKYFAAFIVGNHYASMTIDMDAQQIEAFLSGIAEILKISVDKELEIIDYLTNDVMGKMVDSKLSLSDIIKNMANSKFNETEKDYMFFVYGTNFEY
jgi:hypothetical protein